MLLADVMSSGHVLIAKLCFCGCFIKFLGASHVAYRGKRRATEAAASGRAERPCAEDPRATTTTCFALYILRFEDAPLFPMVEPHPTPCLSAFLLYKARILDSSSRQSYVTIFRMGMSM